MSAGQTLQSVMNDYMNTANHKLSRLNAQMCEIRGLERPSKSVGLSLSFVEDMRADLTDLQVQWKRVQRNDQTS